MPAGIEVRYNHWYVLLWYLIIFLVYSPKTSSNFSGDWGQEIKTVFPQKGQLYPEVH